MIRSNVLGSLWRAASALVLFAIMAVMLGVVGSVIILFSGLWLLANIVGVGLVALVIGIAVAAIFSRLPK